MNEVKTEEIITAEKVTKEDIDTIRKKISEARSRKNENINLNSEAKSILVIYSKKLHLSGRGIKNTQSIAKTISILEKSKEIRPEHVLEALSYRKSF
jgi:predicted ATPase with chaperone activity